MPTVCPVHQSDVCSLWCSAIMVKHLCEPPHHFYCPITLELMHHPVTDEFGFTFEKSALESNISFRNYLCPSTGEGYQFTHLKSIHV